MKVCIYCKNSKELGFKGVEHVIPKSFGSFDSGTPTLDCVCDMCNQYFGDNLDQQLARETVEGVTRYRKGIFSKENRPTKNVTFSLAETEKEGEFGGALVGGFNPVTGEALPLVPQFWIKNIKSKQWERYKISEIKKIAISDEKYGSSDPGSREMRILAPSPETGSEVLEELRKYNIPYRETGRLETPPFLKDIDVDGRINIQGYIESKVGKVEKRAIVKILFNFAAYHLGVDEILKNEWDKARKFIRYNRKTLLGRISSQAFWTGQETTNIRFTDDSYNIRIENQNNNVVGAIQFFNLGIYEFILVENYSLSTNKEVAYRFTPGQKPFLGVKVYKN